MNKFLIENEGLYFNVQEEKLTELSLNELSSEVFIEFGNDTPPEFNLLKELKFFKILFWTDDEDVDAIKVNVKATPLQQTIISQSISLTDNNIIGIDNIDIEDEGSCLYSISVDDGTTWSMIAGNEWVNTTDTNKGMTSTTVKSITSDKWNEVVAEADAIFIKTILFSESDKLTSIKITFLNN